MLDREQRDMVMKLFGEGVGVSEIAGKVGVSRQTVYHVIQSDFDEDAEIHALKKQLKKAELQEKIREVKKPLKMRNELAVVKKAVDGLISRVLLLYGADTELSKIPQECLYCGEELEYVEEGEGASAVQGYRCNRCKKVFYTP